MEHEQHAIDLFLDPSLTLFDIAERCACTISELTQWVNSDAPQALLADLRALADFRVALIVAEALPDAARVLARLAAREPQTPAQAESSRKAAGQLVRMRAPSRPGPSDPDDPGDDPRGDPDDRDGPRDDGGLDDNSDLRDLPREEPPARSDAFGPSSPVDLAHSAPTEPDRRAAPGRTARTTPDAHDAVARLRMRTNDTPEPARGTPVRTHGRSRANRPLKTRNRHEVGTCRPIRAGLGSGEVTSPDSGIRPISWRGDTAGNRRLAIRTFFEGPPSRLECVSHVPGQV